MSPPTWRGASEEFVRESGALAVHAYDQPETMLGQGTVGLEIEADLPEIDTLLVAVGGGGLIGGIAAWYGGQIRIVGVEPETAPTLHAALAAGRPVDAPAGGILEVLATDPGATKDFEHFCQTTGCDLIEASEEPGGILRFRLRKPG